MTNKKSGNIALGHFIKKKRLECQITPQEMAKKVSITETTYLKYEDGSLSIFIDHLVLFSKIFNIDLNLLFNIYLNSER
ncbi:MULTISPECIES: helix-turn-helix domain-containing protein [Providencia]|jgi:transcriptional regulator with XRE-family HTH domain|uniref:helix-turn-helix domain-containing protein n=1 Tax=Providencia TaxID=586 RepID=UPI001C5B5B9C|nr:MULTISPECIES: helix-turn-helix transcriptional regulator [Providencia]ELR5152046.1 helix-turn-helix transcriptional regulator [Providencia rettgeri]ELR5153283.1 helix-turn-helix transcriptional regulator [Providencia rettgeri]QXX84464.1 helix-turn-helix transcriptional regulator [Providencia sp. R33]